MAFDVKCYDFADVWLKANGWNNEIDKAKLAQLIQDLCDDFLAELEEQYDLEGLGHDD